MISGRFRARAAHDTFQEADSRLIEAVCLHSRNNPSDSDRGSCDRATILLTLRVHDKLRSAPACLHIAGAPGPREICPPPMGNGATRSFAVMRCTSCQFPDSLFAEHAIRLPSDKFASIDPATTTASAVFVGASAWGKAKSSAAIGKCFCKHTVKAGIGGHCRHKFDRRGELGKVDELSADEWFRQNTLPERVGHTVRGRL
jgi:hypothetical protein